jgi:transcriptional regulator
MYQPPHFREDDPAVQHALIRAHPLGLLITSGPGGLLANPLPFHLDASASPKGTLRVHMAKANPQWREILSGSSVLVVFQGAESYITPSWYAVKRETGKVVPTWNYAIVQVRGAAKVFEDAEWLRVQVGALTAEHENERPAAWSVTDAPETFIAGQLKGIVGVEIEIDAIEGKWKVSQNRQPADIDEVVAGLSTEKDPHANADMARLVEAARAKATRP